MLDGLAVLAGSSLIRMEETAGESRVAMLETIREYGGERLAERSEATLAAERHAAYYLALAQRAADGLVGPQATAWLARLDAEHDNLRAALRRASDRGDRTAVLHLAGALWRFWIQRGHLSEGRQWFAEAFALPVGQSQAAPATEVNWLTGAARLAIEQAAFAEATARCQQAATVASERGDAAAQAIALNIQGLLARRLNHYAESARAYQAALALAQRPATTAARQRPYLAWPTRRCSPATPSGPAHSANRASLKRGSPGISSSSPKRCPSSALWRATRLGSSRPGCWRPRR